MNLERLWTPWRMQYVGGAPDQESECVFCALPASGDDVASLIVHRDQHVFAMLNLFPYNTGHLLVVPYDHVPTPADASEEALIGITMLMKKALPILQRALGNHGANVGINIGAISGAGIAEHLHQHIVPRWSGDANFMPIVGGTKVLPELLPVTYAKIRAEFARLIGPNEPVQLVAFDQNRGSVLLDTASERLPSIDPAEDGQPVWRNAGRYLGNRFRFAELVGWGGSSTSSPEQTPGLTFVCDEPSESAGGLEWLPVREAFARLDPDTAGCVESALARSRAVSSDALS